MSASETTAIENEVTRAAAVDAIRGLLALRGADKTICPSEAARALGGNDGFRALMPLVRDAARTLASAREIEVTQRGKPVDIDFVRGPIRLRLVQSEERLPIDEGPAGSL